MAGNGRMELGVSHRIMGADPYTGVWYLDTAKSRIWLANSSNGHADVTIKRYDTVADDWATAIITREQYEAALAASKRCDHEWIPSEGRTQSGYLCSKCGNYDGPGYDWIDWPGGECPVPTGTLVDVKWRDGRIDDGIPAKISHDLDSSKRNAIRWQHHGNSHDIIAYRLNQPHEAAQTKEDDETDLNECIGQDAAPVWNGEGLPPVGCVCERSWAGDKWLQCEIIFTGNEIVLVKLATREAAYRLSDVRFRPIRSEAERKRDAAVEAIDRYMPEFIPDTPNDYYNAKKIYDAIAAGKIPGVKLDD